MTDVVAEIRTMVASRGAELYGGEAVTQEQHALQCAMLAEDEGATPALIAAALLHDIGHLLDPGFDDAPAETRDKLHEAVGGRFLTRWFGPEVTEPVRLHVDAKRYLCAIDPSYRATLSPASEHSLMLQGGPMGGSEAAAFIAQPHADAAVRLRGWDDRAKDPHGQTPPLDHFLGYVAHAVRAGRHPAGE
ncbi:HD domain-containing protein [Kaustia mangrovi]|uniref:HD domain-containing protein n=1 Tax=Kaustia mangrovi TaxID=2593653 RepID=A0A7S8C5L9_9HYPH|nr:phosphonate degradation HD-domain oxygenase [Kaustia mangrovi]QPC43818.1 HD domain-containing protein [Kaustia mangrovi]